MDLRLFAASALRRAAFLAALAGLAAPVSAQPMDHASEEPPAASTRSGSEASASAPAATVVAGEDDEIEVEPDRGGDITPGVLPVLGALVPGVLVHGLGHRIGGDRRTASWLLRAEGVGLGVAVAAGIPLALTGANRRLALPAIPLVVGGLGSFLLGWTADIYGAAGGARVTGEPRLDAPVLALRAGYLYVHDPQFEYASVADFDARARVGPWSVAAAASLALDDDHQRARLGGGYRLWGPRPDRASADGTYFDLDAAVAMSHFGSDGFTTWTGEVFVHGRYDLARIGPSLRGAFADMGVGLALELADYDDGDTDVGDLLLADFGFGVYLGRPEGAHGELRVGYDHRRDDFAGGLAVRGGGGGFAGSFSASGFVRVAGPWGVSARFELGSAYVAGLGLLYIGS
ncbi:hypothetical protein [Haliangium sp.]|uniref:hypothetical protein n=1 Tax=Haliangium sp. TaxID=2663208 RepID=UPI003D143F47